MHRWSQQFALVGVLTGAALGLSLASCQRDDTGGRTAARPEPASTWTATRPARDVAPEPTPAPTRTVAARALVPALEDLLAWQHDPRTGAQTRGQRLHGDAARPVTPIGAQLRAWFGEWRWPREVHDLSQRQWSLLLLATLVFAGLVGFVIAGRGRESVAETPAPDDHGAPVLEESSNFWEGLDVSNLQRAAMATRREASGGWTGLGHPMHAQAVRMRMLPTEAEIAALAADPDAPDETRLFDDLRAGETLSTVLDQFFDNSEAGTDEPAASAEQVEDDIVELEEDEDTCEDHVAASGTVSEDGFLTLGTNEESLLGEPDPLLDPNAAAALAAEEELEARLEAGFDEVLSELREKARDGL